MSSTGMKTAWKSASAVSCALASAQRSAFTCVAPTIRSTLRSHLVSASVSSTRSTTYVASTATCALRHALLRPLLRPSSSSSRSVTAKTRSIPRTNCSSKTTVCRSIFRGKTGVRAKTSTHLAGCVQPLLAARPRMKASLAGQANSVTACDHPRPDRTTKTQSLNQTTTMTIMEDTTNGPCDRICRSSSDHFDWRCWRYRR
ncbi:UNVERIFIED_CONTAM: hypothetical protein GTU68_056286 [Idotea baltica]|nr:hypothetical protein [Idotea baltica]